MSCTECEKRLALGENGRAVEDHLRACPQCRDFDRHLRANEAALRALRDEVLPAARLAGIPGRRRGWIPAVAAALVIGLVLPQMGRFRPIGAPPVVARPSPPESDEPLKIKMLTSDPDVVIYWLIEPKQGESKEREQ